MSPIVGDFGFTSRSGDVLAKSEAGQRPAALEFSIPTELGPEQPARMVGGLYVVASAARLKMFFPSKRSLAGTIGAIGGPATAPLQRP